MNLKIHIQWAALSADEIRPEHEEALKESAITQIAEQMLQGYTSGELHDNIHMLDDDPEEGLSYGGWWSLETE